MNSARKYYLKNRTARITYAKQYYQDNRLRIRIYQNNYFKGYYRRNKMTFYIKMGQKQNHKMYLKNQEKILMRKYFKKWQRITFGERNRIRKMLTLQFD